MSNNFPTVPADLALASVEYAADWGNASQAGTALTFAGTTVQFGGALSGLGSGSAIVYTFNTPGTPGSFDQTTAETGIKKVVTDASQVLADLTGATLAQVQAMATIKRHWAWTNAAGNRATYTDTLTYP